MEFSTVLSIGEPEAKLLNQYANRYSYDIDTIVDDMHSMTYICNKGESCEECKAESTALLNKFNTHMMELVDAICQAMHKANMDGQSYEDTMGYIRGIGIPRFIWRILGYAKDNETSGCSFCVIHAMVACKHMWIETYASELAEIVMYYNDIFSPIHIQTMMADDANPYARPGHFRDWTESMLEDITLEWCKRYNNGKLMRALPIKLYSNSIFFKLLSVRPDIISVVVHLFEAGLINDGMDSNQYSKYFNQDEFNTIYVKDKVSATNNKQWQTSISRLSMGNILDTYIRNNVDALHYLLDAEIKEYRTDYSLQVMDNQPIEGIQHSGGYSSLRINQYNGPLIIVNECLQYTECGEEDEKYNEAFVKFLEKNCDCYNDEKDHSVVYQFVRAGYSWMYELLQGLFRKFQFSTMSGEYHHSPDMRNQLPDYVLHDIKYMLGMIYDEEETPVDDSIKLDISELSIDIKNDEETKSEELPEDHDNATLLQEDTSEETEDDEIDNGEDLIHIINPNIRVERGFCIRRFPVRILFADFMMHSTNTLRWIRSRVTRENIDKLALDSQSKERSDLRLEMLRVMPIYIARFCGIIIPNKILGNPSMSVRNKEIVDICESNQVIFGCSKAYIGEPNEIHGYDFQSFYNFLMAALKYLVYDYPNAYPDNDEYASILPVSADAIDVLTTIKKVCGSETYLYTEDRLNADIDDLVEDFTRALDITIKSDFGVPTEKCLWAATRGVEAFVPGICDPVRWRDCDHKGTDAMPLYMTAQHSVMRYNE